MGGKLHDFADARLTTGDSGVCHLDFFFRANLAPLSATQRALPYRGQPL